MAASLDFLSRAEFGDEDIVGDHPRHRPLVVIVFLIADRNPFESTRVDGAVVVELLGIGGGRDSVAVLGAGDLENED